ncbi:MAG: hypothetical protein ACOYYJ_00315 [Chloroflexota bacterium]
MSAFFLLVWILFFHEQGQKKPEQVYFTRQAGQAALASKTPLRSQNNLCIMASLSYTVFGRDATDRFQIPPIPPARAAWKRSCRRAGGGPPDCDFHAGGLGSRLEKPAASLPLTEFGREKRPEGWMRTICNFQPINGSELTRIISSVIACATSKRSMKAQLPQLEFDLYFPNAGKA